MTPVTDETDEKTVIITTATGDKLVPSGLFAYYSCSDTSLYLNMSTLDLDQDGFMGIQCVGGVWDTQSLPTDVVSVRCKS